MVPAGTLRDLYEKQGMTADEVGELTSVSRHTVLRSAHALGIPVRTGGAVQLSGPDEIELVGALYEDDLITSVLRAHDIAPVPGGPIWDRFPEPVPLSTPLVKDLYWYCGAGLSHIELLTGQHGPRPYAGSCAARAFRCGHRADGPRSCGAGGTA